VFNSSHSQFLILLQRRMAATPKLTYFPARGRAELIRLALVQAGVHWEEETCNQDSLAKLKENGILAFNQVPLYQEGDFHLVQSLSIARYVASSHNLRGKDVHEAALIDQFVDGIEELLNKLAPSVFPKINEEGIKKFQSEIAPQWFGYFERALDKSSSSGWLVGNQVSLADIYLFELVEMMFDDNSIGDKSKYPKLIAHAGKMSALPNIAAWLKSEKRYPTRRVF